MTINKIFKLCLLAALAISSCPALAEDIAAAKPLEVGVIPYMSARVLVNSYEPLRQYLEKVLGKPVKIYTANGFKPFLLNAQRGNYDLVISAAHFARILQKDNQFIPLVRYSKGGRGLVMVALDGPIKTPQDLKGQIIAVPDKLSLASIVCMTALQEKGIKSGTDFKLLEVPSFESAILSIQKGDAAAAFSALGALKSMKKELQESVRPIVDSGEYISLVFLANPQMGTKYSTLLRNTLLKFGSETNEGHQFFARTGFGSIIPVTPQDMKSLDRYATETKRLLNESP